jgi:hypothetical protein
VGTYRLDLDVYRHGGQVWLHGGRLYDTLSLTGAGTPMLFTYPPFAAVLFSPLAVAPLEVDGAVFTVISIALTGVVIAVTLHAQGYRLRWWGLAAVMSVALLLEPVRDTLGWGQINLVLLVAVIADVLLASVLWPRGLLVGLAAAVKLTPLVGLLFLCCAATGGRWSSGCSVCSVRPPWVCCWLRGISCGIGPGRCSRSTASARSQLPATRTCARSWPGWA